MQPNVHLRNYIYIYIYTHIQSNYVHLFSTRVFSHPYSILHHLSFLLLCVSVQENMISLYGSLWGILFLLIIKFTPTSAPAGKQTFAEWNKSFSMGVIDTTGLQLHNYTPISTNQMCSSMFSGPRSFYSHFKHFSGSLSGSCGPCTGWAWKTSWGAKGLTSAPRHPKRHINHNETATFLPSWADRGSIYFHTLATRLSPL